MSRSQPPALSPYTLYEITKVRPSSDLYALSDRVLAKDIAEIVRVEGPVHVDVLYQRMAKLHGIDRAGSEVRRVVDRSLREAERAGDVVRRRTFLWPPGVERVAPRLAGPRTVDQVAPEELHEVILVTLHALDAASRDELIRAVARTLGFQRTGSALTAGIGTAMDALYAGGQIVSDARGLRTAT